MLKTSGSFSKHAVAMIAVGTFVWGLAGPVHAVGGGDCGNGTVDVGEECDTGAANGTASSCCSAACSFEAPTKVCRPATGSCDVAETCTGASSDCPAVDAVQAATYECGPQLGPCDAADFCDGVTKVCPSDFDGGPDADGDGVCDAGDICNDLDGQRGFATGTKAKLLVKGTVAMKATAFGTLPAGTTFSDLDPSARGALFEIGRADGTPLTPVLSLTLPTGTFNGFRGWKRNATGIKWSYIDKTVHALVSRAKIESKASQAPGRVKVTVKGRPMSEAASDDLPLSVVFAFGDNSDSQLGRCLEARFQAAECRQASVSTLCQR